MTWVFSYTPSHCFWIVRRDPVQLAGRVAGMLKWFQHKTKQPSRATVMEMEAGTYLLPVDCYCKQSNHVKKTSRVGAEKRGSVA